MRQAIHPIVLILFGLNAFYPELASAAPGACAQIKSACRAAGFVPGGKASGNGLMVDCLNPLIGGATTSRHGKVLPKIDPSIVSACRAEQGIENVPVATPIPLTSPKLGPGSHPNIVFILADDLSLDLVRYMPHVLEMEKNGASFDNYFVTDSLCCPSRSSIFTGRFPHDTGVFKNQGIDGGYQTFLAKGNDKTSFSVALTNAAYKTAMMGKYLNGYQPAERGPDVGWSGWDVAGHGYANFNYSLNQNGKVVHYGRAPGDYLTDVIADLGVAFVRQAAGQPFFLEEATFAPHAPYTPAPRDAAAFPGLKAPRTPAFNVAPDAAGPNFLKGIPALTDQDIEEIDTHYRMRAQSVLAVDALIAKLQAATRAAGADKNTYFVFSSDNGYHMGEHRMHEGKMTAFDTDIHVPLVITGPGVAPGSRIQEITQNVDLCPTFTELAGAATPPQVDGRSLVPLLRGQAPSGWRTATLVEHHGGPMSRTDPDAPIHKATLPPTYEALRTKDLVYVEYSDGEREYHDLKSDPYELKNTYGTLSTARKSSLAQAVAALKSCHGDAACRAAARPQLAP